jgi:hypothetical protein
MISTLTFLLPHITLLFMPLNIIEVHVFSVFVDSDLKLR